MLYPTANKTNLVKLLKEKGYDIPNMRKAALTTLYHSFWLRWTDSKGEQHTAYYTGSAGRPVLQVDKDWVKITMADAIHYGLVEEK